MKKPDLKNLKPSVLTNNDVLQIVEILSNVEGVKGTPLVYAISRSLAKLRPVHEALSQNSCIPQTEEYEKYTKESQEIHMKYSQGKTRELGGVQVHSFPWLDDNSSEKNTSVQKQKVKWEKEIAELNSKYTEEIKIRNLDIEEYTKFLNEPFSEDITEYFHTITSEKLDLCEVPDGLRHILSYMVTEESK